MDTDEEKKTPPQHELSQSARTKRAIPDTTTLNAQHKVKKRVRVVAGLDDDDDDDADAEMKESAAEQQAMDLQAEAKGDHDDDGPAPSFPPLSATAAGVSLATTTSSSPVVGSIGYLRISVPPHRYSPCKAQWLSLYSPCVEQMKLQIRFNTRRRCIELRTSPLTDHPSAIHKAADFLRAFIMGFEVKDAISLLRLDDLYVDSFEIKDVKTLTGEHLSRAIGRIAGQQGKTKFTIENATKTRIVIADTHIHILGSAANITIAKNALVRLIMGSPPGKVYTQMRAVANRAKERF